MKTARPILSIGIVGVITFAGYFVLYPQTLFMPGDDIGYTLGLVGGLMMLIMLPYSLRKRIKFLERLGILSNWFRWHMVLGMLGPLIIIFHSTYHVYIPYLHPTGSVNAAVAMLCMLLVSGSGVFGRFIYTKVHYSFYGRLITVSELREGLVTFGDMKSVFSFAPTVEKSLGDFHTRADGHTRRTGFGILNFLTVGYQAMMLSRSLPREIRRIMIAQAAKSNLNAHQRAILEKLILKYQKRIVSYLKAVRDVSQFSTYERLFSIWHIFHVPLVYMLVFSVLYHVYAVLFY